jgi:Rnl2 family RNA ligase
MLERYRERVLRLFRLVKDRYSDLETLSVYGEMFGGSYPHPAVPAVRGASVIQRGVYYSPSHEFYGFDLLIRGASPQPPVTSIGDMESPTMESGERYLGVSEVSELFASAEMLYARVLFEGSLSECISYPNAFITKIPEWLGLPALEDNICEGIVIRPVEACFLTSGSRVLLKSKNDRFKEKSHLHRGGVVEPSYSPELSLMLDTIASYITENRLSNVVSKIGEVSFPRDIGKVMGLLSRDALEDFMKENECAYMELDRAEQKLVTKRASVLSAELIKGRIRKSH